MAACCLGRTFDASAILFALQPVHKWLYFLARGQNVIQDATKVDDASEHEPFLDRVPQVGPESVGSTRLLRQLRPESVGSSRLLRQSLIRYHRHF
tara:strand:+ start:322 stop:606 length:285 start_codon:yes stop_codon:yes gene_type:complete